MDRQIFQSELFQTPQEIWGSEKNWKGTVKVEVKEHKGKEYIAVT